MTKREYFERHGSTPYDAIAPGQRSEHVAALRLACFVRLLQEHHESRVVVTGMGQPDAVEALMDYRIGFRGLGEGRIELWIVDPATENK